MWCHFLYQKHGINEELNDSYLILNLNYPNNMIRHSLINRKLMVINSGHCLITKRVKSKREWEANSEYLEASQAHFAQASFACKASVCASV